MGKMILINAHDHNNSFSSLVSFHREELMTNITTGYDARIPPGIETSIFTKDFTIIHDLLLKP